MRKVLLKFAVYLIPLPVYIAIVMLIDPFNYFGISSWISEDTKSKTSLKLNPQLWKMVQYKKEKCKRIILGDSRAARVDVDHIKEMTGQIYYNFSFPGGTLIDMIEAFWYADSLTSLSEVYIGLNFNLYNDFEKNNKMGQAKSTLNNFFSYSFSKIVLSTMIQNVKSNFFEKDVQIGRPEMSFDDFWSYEINVIGKRYFSKYKHPDSYYASLLEISNYCKEKNIKLVYFIPPNHIEWQQRIEDFNLKAEHQIFLDDISKLGTVYNMDLDNEFTRNKKNFRDPVHLANDSLILYSVWGRNSASR